MWRVSTTAEFDAWFATLPGDAQVEMIAKVDLLKIFGPRLTRPHADTLKGSKHANLKELRVDTSSSALRIAFAFDPTRTAILLVAGDKSGVGKRQFYRRLIAQAERLYDAHLLRLKASEKERRT